MALLARAALKSRGPIARALWDGNGGTTCERRAGAVRGVCTSDAWAFISVTPLAG